MRELLKVLIILFLSMLMLDFSIAYIKEHEKPLISNDNSLYIEPIDGFTPSMVADLYYDEREIYGDRHNPVIVKFLNEFVSWVKDDETAWCSAFVNYTAAVAGYETSGKLNARSWLKMGKSSINDPIPGDVVVLWRVSKQDWRGHVGYFVRYSEDRTKVYIKGGNQGNKVSIHPYNSERILDIRRLKKIRPDISTMFTKDVNYTMQLDYEEHIKI